MQRLIRYLYEYQEGRKVRNVGFVKVEDSGDFLSLWIYGNEFPASADGRLEIFLFYQMEEKCVGISLGEIQRTRSMMAYQMNYEGNTSKLEGVVLRETQDEMTRWYAAGWKEPLPQVEQMIEESLLELQRTETQEEPRAEAQAEPQGEETKVGIGVEQPENKEDGEKESEEKKDLETEAPLVYKITRKALVQLPREEWKLANNRFLMHGCRNYHHLISFEKDGNYWLGVPGIYHPQEERAARAFGFVEFMTPDEGELQLTEEEKSRQEEFGYWCRTVNNIIKG